MSPSIRRRPLVLGSLLALTLVPPVLLTACAADPAAVPCPTPTTTATTPPAASGARVSSVVLKSLDVVEAEYGDPIAIDYPVTVEMTLEVTGEAFTADVGVGMESADGSLRCFLGNISTTHNVPKDVATTTSTLPLMQEFYVPPTCRPLVGQKDARVWVSFDMFGRLNVEGRTPLVAGDDAKLEPFLQQSRLATDRCESEYAESCIQPFSVMESPGRDLIMAKVDLSTAVGVVEYQEKTYLPDVKPGEKDYQGNPLKPLDQSKFFARLSTSPQVVVNSTIKVYGGDGTDETALPAGAARVSVYLSPNQQKTEGAADLDPSLPFFEPMPMSLEVVKKDKGTNAENILRLQNESVDRLVDAQTVTMVSSAFVDGALLEQMTNGMWSKVNSYIMTVCVDSDIQEATPESADPETGEAADPTLNNCRDLEFEIVRRPKPATLDGINDPSSVSSEGAAPEKAFSSKWDTNLGDSDKVRLGLRVSAGVRGDAKSFDIGFNGLLETRGWVNFPLAEIDLAMRDYIDPKTKDEIRTKLNFLLWSNENVVPLPDGDLKSFAVFGEKDKKTGQSSGEITKDGPDLAFAQSVGPITVIALAKFTGTVGAQATLSKKPSEETKDCSDGTKVGQSCLRLSDKVVNFYDAQAYCRDKGGSVASPTSKEYLDALQKFRKDKDVEAIWTGIRHFNASTNAVGSCKDFERSRNDARNKLQECYNTWYKSNASCDRDFKADADAKSQSLETCQKDFAGKPGFRADWLTAWRDTNNVETPASIPWLPGNPDDHGDSGEGFVTLYEKGLNDAPAPWERYAVCETQIGAGTFFGVSVSPFARLSSKFFAKLSFGGVVEGSVDGDMVLGEINFTNEAGLTWQQVPEQKAIYSYVSAKSGLEASVLKGKIDYLFRVNVPFIPDVKGNLYKSDEGKKIPLFSFIDEKSKVNVLKY